MAIHLVFNLQLQQYDVNPCVSLTSCPLMCWCCVGSWVIGVFLYSRRKLLFAQVLPGLKQHLSFYLNIFKGIPPQGFKFRALQSMILKLEMRQHRLLISGNVCSFGANIQVLKLILIQINYAASSGSQRHTRWNTATGNCSSWKCKPWSKLSLFHLNHRQNSPICY